MIDKKIILALFIVSIAFGISSVSAHDVNANDVKDNISIENNTIDENNGEITLLSVLSATDITMKYLDGTQFKANLVDGQGKPYAEQTIKFNVNGVLYCRATDSNGQVALDIRLPPGEYIITSSFNGCNVANKITITN